MEKLLDLILTIIVFIVSIFASLGILFVLSYIYDYLATHTMWGNRGAEFAEINRGDFTSIIVSLFIIWLFYQLMLFFFNLIGHGLFGLEYVDGFCPDREVRDELREFLYRR